MKQCKTCAEVKPLTAFYKNKQCKDGYVNECKTCRLDKDKEKYKESGKRAPLHRELLNNAMGRAKQKNIEFCLTDDWLLTKLATGICEATGLPFGARKSAFTPSLDRTDPTKGYTPDNVKVTVWIYNRCKGIHSHEDVMTMALALTGAIH